MSVTLPFTAKIANLWLKNTSGVQFNGEAQDCRTLKTFGFASPGEGGLVKMDGAKSSIPSLPSVRQILEDLKDAAVTQQNIKLSPMNDADLDTAYTILTNAQNLEESIFLQNELNVRLSELNKEITESIDTVMKKKPN